VLSILSIASVFGFFWFYERNHSAAYFLTPTRIWELGIGALAFIGLKNAPFFRLRFDSGVLFNAALIGLLASFFIPKAFSGWTTLASALLTAALLMSPQNLAMTKVLSLPPTVYVGKISYSLYLWHWPLITLLPYLSNPLLRTTAFTVVAIFVVAIASYHLLEKPLRHARWSNSRGTDVAIGVGASVVFCLAILFAQDRTSRTMETAEVSPYPPAFLPLKKSGLPYNPHCVVDGIKRLLTPDTFQLCTTPAIPGSRMPTIWAMGDSHAGQLQGLLYELHENIGVGIHLIETPRFAFPPVTPDIFPPRVVIFEETLSRLQAGDIVLLSRLYLTRRGLPKPRGDFYTWSERVSRLAVQLEELGVSIVIMGPPPMFQFEDIRSCDPVDVNSCVLERSQYLPYLQPVHHMLDDLAEHHQNVLWFHTFDALCPPTSRYCRSSEGGVFLYRDREHLNSYGAKQLATPFVYFLRNSDVLPR
jgi:hypothetical protein